MTGSHCPSCYSIIAPGPLQYTAGIHSENSSTILQEIARVSLLLSTLHTHFNATRPAVRLPPEILGDIFHYVRSESLDDDSPIADAFMYVCQRWRSVALATPAIWGYINATRDPDDVRAVLARSRESPLALLAHAREIAPGGTPLFHLGPYGGPSSKPLYATAVPRFGISHGLAVVLQDRQAIARIRHLDIHQPWSAHRDIFEALAVAMPHLTWAKLSLTNCERHAPARPVRLDAPFLRVLCMDNCSFTPTPALSSSLCDLTLSGTLADGPTVLLTDMPKLESLRLQAVTWPGLQVVLPVYLPSLKTCTQVENSATITRLLLSNLQYPSSTQTEIIYRPDSNSKAEAASLVEALREWAMTHGTDVSFVPEVRLTEHAIEFLVYRGTDEPNHEPIPLLRVLHEGRRRDCVVIAPNGQPAYPPAEVLRLDPSYLQDTMSVYWPLLHMLNPRTVVFVDNEKWLPVSTSTLLQGVTTPPRIIFRGLKPQCSSRHPPTVLRAMLSLFWPECRVREVVIDGAWLDASLVKHLCDFFEKKREPTIRIVNCSFVSEASLDGLREGGRTVLWYGENV